MASNRFTLNGITLALFVLLATGVEHAALAQGPSLPAASPLAFDPPPSQPRTVITPRTETKLITFRTTGGRGNIDFSFSLPFGVPPGAFERFTSTSAPAGIVSQREVETRERLQGTGFSPARPASFTLKYKGCESGCPNTLTVTVTARDSANGVASQNVLFVLTTAKVRPVIRTITEVSAPSGSSTFGGRFYRIEAEPDSYSARDQGSEVIGIYTGSFRYSLGIGLTPVRVPRLGRERSVEIRLKNPYGESNPVTVTLPPDSTEILPAPPERPGLFQAVVVIPQNGPTRFTASHGGVIPTSRIDSFPAESTGVSQGCANCITARGSISTALGCGQVGAVYDGARVSVISETFGSAALRFQPAIGEMLGTGQAIGVNWSHGVGGVAYEVVFKLFFVEGICQNRRR